MLVTFKTESSPDVTLFGDIALELLGMMGRDQDVPGALYAEDVPAALRALSKAIKRVPAEPPATKEEHEEPMVSIKHRALPLIELLRAAAETKSRVRWE